VEIKMARVKISQDQKETVYVSLMSASGVRETERMQILSSVIDTFDWHDGVDNTPWKTPCLVAKEGDRVYYRYPQQ
jgi:hypothetical protein